jgi:hypothetical protein
MTTQRTIILGVLAVLFAGSGVQAEDWNFSPYAIIVGGMKFQHYQPTEYADSSVPEAPEDERSRFFTMALSRFGLRSTLSGGFSLVSEFELNAGIDGHGSSVWEGQAAIQVRQQLIRFERWGLRVDAGHVQDDSSIDFFSDHVVDLLLTDSYTRGPYLASGANRGNGIYATYHIWEGLGVGFTFNAGSPVTTTSTPVVGGTYSPYQNFYGGIIKALGDNPYRLPSEMQHFMLLTPSLTYDCEFLQAHASLQIFRVDTQIQSEEDDPIEGTNIRAGLKGRLLDGMLVPFANFSMSGNNVTGGAHNPATLEGQDWSGMTIGGGLDFNFQGKSGVGGQFVLVQGQQKGSPAVDQYFINVGGTWWLTDTTSLGARVGYHRFVSEEKAYGDMSFFLTARAII